MVEESRVMSKAKMQVGRGNESTRNDWVKERLASIPEGWRLLDAGAGEQQYRPLCEHLEYVSQDFAQYDGSGDESGLHVGSWDNSGLDIVGDIADIPESDSSFDAILCTEVFEHLPEPLKAIQEFSRLLRSGGELIITAPFCSMTHFSPYHFSTGFNRYYYETHLPNNGFEIIEMRANGNYYEYIAQELIRLPSIAERYANTKASWFDRLARKQLIAFLQKATERDQGSDELLCFGYHVHARKTGE